MMMAAFSSLFEQTHPNETYWNIKRLRPRKTHNLVVCHSIHLNKSTCSHNKQNSFHCISQNVLYTVNWKIVCAQVCSDGLVWPRLVTMALVSGANYEWTVLLTKASQLEWKVICHCSLSAEKSSSEQLSQQMFNHTSQYGFRLLRITVFIIN